MVNRLREVIGFGGDADANTEDDEEDGDGPAVDESNGVSRGWAGASPTARRPSNSSASTR